MRVGGAIVAAAMLVGGGCEIVLATDPNPQIIDAGAGGHTTTSTHSGSTDTGGTSTGGTSTGTGGTGTGGTGTGGAMPCTPGEVCDPPIAIAAGYNHTCALLHDGDVYCWGFNQVGEVGDGSTADKHKPTKVGLPMAATAIAAGGRYLGTDYSAHSCAVLSDKSLWCWGSNANAELGVGDAAAHLGPVQVPLTGVSSVAVRGAHTCAIVSSGDLHCWGRNAYGQVGVGSTTSPILSPTQIASSVQHVAIGDGYTCMIKTNGMLYCWGENNYGQLGDGNKGAINSTDAPGAPIAGLANVAEVVCGKATTCARNGVGVYCWGYNNGGDVGNGTTTTMTTPQPLALAGATHLAFGEDHGGALTAGGLYTWGVNASGQLGDGTGQNSLTPKHVNIPGLAAISFSQSSSCGLGSDHVMYCWGDNTYGQFGDGSTFNSSSPVAVVWH
jgi:alpha-tubulin suppressor-like RCC1 family protein